MTATDPNSPTAASAAKALRIGLAGIAVTALGLIVSPVRNVAAAWLVGLVYWTAIAIGMLVLVLIHHIFDAQWSTVVRRQMEHALASFKWLALLFLPLLVISFIPPRDWVWPWLNPAHLMPAEGKTVGTDIIYAKKMGFLNLHALVIWTAAFFGLWIWLSARLRKNSFTQDLDGDPKWTKRNGFTAGFGLPIMGLTLTFAAIFWIKSL